MEVRATRARRLRTRRALGRAAVAVTLAAGALFWSRALADEGQQAPALSKPEAPPALGGPTDVGVWVVEGPGGSGDLSGIEGPVAAESHVGFPPGRTAHVVVMGKDFDVRTNAGTVRELLSAMGIEPGGNDRVLPPPGTPLSRERLVRVVDTAFLVGRSMRPGSFERALFLEHAGKQANPRTRNAGLSLGPVSGGSTATGEASWYDRPGLTAAHPTLPFGTPVLVTNVATGSSVTVVIDDRGPSGGRIIDLSDEAFERIAPLSQGVAQVRLTW